MRTSLDSTSVVVASAGLLLAFHATEIVAQAVSPDAHESLRQTSAAASSPAPPPTLAEDIEAMRSFGEGAVRAGQRLVERGPAATPEIHAALRSSRANPIQRRQLLTILGEIGDPGSSAVIVEVARAHSDEALVQGNAFLALSRLPETPEATAFAEEVLDSPDAGTRSRRGALVYLAEQRSPRGRRHLDRYLEAADPHIRAAALYLAAALREPSAGDRIAAYLAKAHPPGPRFDLLRALAEVSDPGELERRVPANLHATDSYRSAVRRARMRRSPPQAKAEICQEMLASRFSEDRRSGLRCLIDAERWEVLEPLIQRDVLPSHRVPVENELRKRGIGMEPRGGRMRIRPETTQ